MREYGQVHFECHDTPNGPEMWLYIPREIIDQAAIMGSSAVEGVRHLYESEGSRRGFRIGEGVIQFGPGGMTWSQPLYDGYHDINQNPLALA